MTVRGQVLRPSPSLGLMAHEAIIHEIGCYTKRGRWRRLPFIERKLTEADLDACREALIDQTY